MLRYTLVPDVLKDLLRDLGAHEFLQAAIGHVVDVKNLFIREQYHMLSFTQHDKHVPGLHKPLVVMCFWTRAHALALDNLPNIIQDPRPPAKWT